MTVRSALFSGRPLPFGGLSNETDLLASCPQEFKDGNRWSDYALMCFAGDVNIASWKWRSDDEGERRRQRSCLAGLLGTFELSHQDKAAVAGWMLSEMLTEVPVG